MDKIAVNAFIHGGALSDPIELNPNLARIFQEKSKEVTVDVCYNFCIRKTNGCEVPNQRGGQVNARYQYSGSR